MRYLSVLLLLVFLSACSNKQQEVKPSAEPDTVTTISDEKLEQAGQLLTTACYVCHSPTLPEKGRLAPPMEAVKRRYSMTSSTEKDFVEAVVTFASAPSEDKSIMLGAVDQFGVMPPLAYSEEDLRAIATFIYRNELPKPEWFDDHYNEMHPGNGMRMQNRKRNGQGAN